MSSTHRKKAARKLSQETNLPYQKALNIIRGQEKPEESLLPAPQPSEFERPEFGPKQPFRDYTPVEFPIGESLTQEEILLNFDDTPHLLLIGNTGSGRTLPLHTIISKALMVPDQGWRLALIDVKSAVFTRYRENTRVLASPVTVLDAVDLLKRAVDELKQRYAKLEEAGVKHYTQLNDTPEKLLIVIEEAYPLLVGIPGSPHEGLAATARYTVGTITRLGRAVGIHLVLSSARPVRELSLQPETLLRFDARMVMGTVDEATLALLLSDDAPFGHLSGRGTALLLRADDRGGQVDALTVYYYPQD